MNAVDETPSARDLTTADAALFAHDRAKPAHDATTCTVDDCWVCAWATPGAPTLGGAA